MASHDLNIVPATYCVQEGVAALWKGISPGIQRQMLFASIRIGLYEPVRNFYCGEGNTPNMLQKIGAGLTTGAIAISVANPTDVVKIRLQAEGRLPAGVKPRYTGSLDAYRKIVADEGLAGLWTGWGVNVARNSVISCAELVSYDTIKTTIMEKKIMADGVPCHIASGLGAGFIATVVGSPIDVTKTRYMNQKADPKTGLKPYKSAGDALLKTIKNEGPGGLYKGFWANFTRIGSWNVVMFMSYEQIKKTFF